MAQRYRFAKLVCFSEAIADGFAELSYPEDGRFVDTCKELGDGTACHPLARVLVSPLFGLLLRRLARYLSSRMSRGPADALRDLDHPRDHVARAESSLHARMGHGYGHTVPVPRLGTLTLLRMRPGAGQRVRGPRWTMTSAATSVRMPCTSRRQFTWPPS